MKIAALFMVTLASFAEGPSTFESRKANAQDLLEKRDYVAALAAAQSINRQWPDDITGYQLLGAGHLGVGNYAEAEQALQWMLDLRIGKADAQGWLLVARFREVTGDVEGAMDAINTGYGKLGPGEERHRIALLACSGRLQYLAGKLDDAERVLRQTLTAAPGNEAALETLARVRMAQGRNSEARDILAELARSTEQPRYLYQLAEAGGDVAVYADFERAARARMHSPDNANRELVLFYSERGKRPAEALDIARTDARHRHDVFTLDALAVALNANGKLADARAIMKQVVKVGVRDPDILRHAAQLGVKPE